MHAPEAAHGQCTAPEDTVPATATVTDQAVTTVVTDEEAVNNDSHKQALGSMQHLAKAEGRSRTDGSCTPEDTASDTGTVTPPHRHRLQVILQSAFIDQDREAEMEP